MRLFAIAMLGLLLGFTVIMAWYAITTPPRRPEVEPRQARRELRDAKIARLERELGIGLDPELHDPFIFEDRRDQ